MARKTISDIAALLNITLEGNLIAPAMLAKVERLDADGQSEADYAVKPGLTIRDEIPRAFRIGQALFSHFAGSDTTTAGATLRFVTQMLTDVFGFSDLQAGGRRQNDGRDYLVHLEAGDGRIPVIVVPPKDSIDRASEALAFDDRKRSASTALQDWLNAEEDALWGLATNGDVIRLMRDNASLTRPAFVEADLKQIFETEDYSSFSALWLLLHRSRFGDKPAPVTDCALERWRDTGSKEGAVVRDRLRDGVEDALRVLGSGFLEANPDLRKRLSEGDLKITIFFNELLRIIYRLIFLMVAEDRDLLHEPDASPVTRQLYTKGYSLKRLRERSIRRSNWDKHRDLYEGLKIVFRSLATGQRKLGLPALGGLFDQGLMPDLEKASLPNRALMEAVYRLAWLKEKDALLPINWREMETEELGSVYESLLELTPRIDIAAKRFYFAEGEETKGNQRKTTGSYYTPDSLVQVLLDSALDPVLDRIEREADDPAEALTKATVIDPACGSGHFLLAAARRIATRVARIRAGGVASATDFRHALRDVARGCIHGVDRNPMAVELTKVALWIETVEPGKPLGFLDANIRCGDALLGVFNLSVLREGIPDEAYKPLTGDDKETAKHFKARNAAEKKGQGAFDFAGGSGNLPAAPPFGTFISDFKALPEDTVEEIAAKQSKYISLQNGPLFWAWRQAADLYISAFLTPKVGGVPDNRNTVTIPTTAHIWQHLGGNNTLYGPLIAVAVDRAAEARAFHWPLEFPDIFQSGGFQVVVGNPPWEKVNLKYEEFFQQHDASVLIDAKSLGKEVAFEKLKVNNPKLYAEYEEAQNKVERFLHSFRHGGFFKLTTNGFINYYSSFAELMIKLTKPTGFAGAILQSGIVTDKTNQLFFEYITSKKMLVSIYDFINSEAIFNIHRGYKFSLLTMSKNNQFNEGYFAFDLTDPSQINQNRFKLSKSDIELVNPNTKTCPTFNTRFDADLVLKVYRSGGILRNNLGTSFNETIELHRMFNATTDRKKFTTLGIDWTAIQSETLPVYESKLIWQYDHRFATFAGSDEADVRNGNASDVIKIDKEDKEYEIIPRWAAPEDSITAFNTKYGWQSEWYIAIRMITGAGNERTLVASVIPKSASVNSVNLVTGVSAIEAAFLLGNLNSIVMDYIVRNKLNGNNLNQWIIEQLPVIPYDKIVQTKYVTDRVLELSHTSSSTSKFAEELGYTFGPFPWDEPKRAVLKAELDAFFAHAYQLSREELSYILDPTSVENSPSNAETFSGLKNKEIKAYGEYRTQRLVLEAFDKLERGELGNEVSIETAIPIAEPISLSTLPDSAWARITPSPLTDPAVALAAILKTVDEPTTIHAIRMAAIMMLEPHLFTPLLTGSDRAEWQRLVGQEANPQVGNIARLPTLTSPGWNTAITNHRGNGRLIEDLTAETWAAGTGLDTFDTAGWPDGRASFALRAIHDLGFDTVLSSAPRVIQEFVNAA